VQQYLEKHPAARLQVYAIWFNMLYGDSRQAWDPHLLTDARAQNFWDEQRFAGRYYAKGHGVAFGAIYDHYYCYPLGARWGDAPRADGSNFYNDTPTLQRALDQLANA
jgi:hypothetical protein